MEYEDVGAIVYSSFISSCRHLIGFKVHETILLYTIKEEASTEFGERERERERERVGCVGGGGSEGGRERERDTCGSL
jgi:hypothetical protein